ncbi:MAG: hypothetical protein P4M04_13710 [Acidobacteriota bacterium]|nr:hypothetical protein [Acidobacteriota bacterium]
MPLWRSLILNLADRISPEKLPPLELTSRPVDTGMMFGDRLALPWFRTVFANISDVVSPEMGPPLELTSRSVDVGELLADDLSHGWWVSLLDGLRYRLSPERQPPLSLTSKPIAVYGARSWLQLLDWSSLLETPKVYLADAPVQTQLIAAEMLETAPTAVAATTAAAVPVDQQLWAAQMQFKRDISRSRFRQKIWMTAIAAEAVFLLAYIFNFKF